MPLTLPISMEDRHFAIGEHCADPFNEGKDHNGMTVIIEIKTKDEAKAIAAALFE